MSYAKAQKYSLENADIETSSDDYATRFNGEVGQWFLDIQSNYVQSCLNDSTIKTVLEVGGGHGQLIDTYLEKELNTTIFSSDEICKKRIQSFIDANKIEFLTGDLINLPFSDNSFDAVIAIRLITHCSNWQKLIKELCRVSKKIVIIDYPPLESSNITYDLLYKFKKSSEGNTRPFTIFKKKTVISEFKNNSLMLEKSYPQFFLPMVIHRKLNNKFISQVIEGFFKITYLTKFFGSPIIASFRK
jgi:ubiquinone/menaquinone biosynthesis C-methylase UbiE